MKTNTHLSFIAAAATLLSAGVISEAAAKDGFYVSGGFNSTNMEHNLTRNTGSADPTNGPADGPSISAVDSDTSFGIGIGLGYHKALTSDFYVEGEIFYSYEDAETRTINNVLVNDVELNATYGLDVKFGHKVTDKFSVYGLGGITGYDIDSTITYTFAPPMDTVSETEFAFTYGGGVEIALNDRWATFAEARISNDVSFDTPEDRGGVVSDNDLNFTVIRSGLKYRF